MRLLLWSSVLLLSLPGFNAMAEISELTVVGASAFDDEETTPIIYGGVASVTGTPTSSTDFNECEDQTVNGTTNGCNNCDDQRIPCNESRIFNGRLLQIQFKSSETGYARVEDEDGDEIPAQNSVTQISAGGVHTIQLDWEDVCDTIDDDASNTCEIGADDPISETVSVGIVENSGDTDLTDSTNVIIRVYAPVTTDTASSDCSGTSELGVCSLEVQDGDEKVYLDPVNIASSFPIVASGINVEKIRIMYSTVSFDDTGPDQNFQDIDVVNDDEIGEDTVDGLDNDIPYAFSFASIDSAGNVAHFMADSLFTAACSGAGVTTTTDVSTLSDSQIAACPYVGLPGEVIGLLKDDINCFIATAAYGTSLGEHLTQLRKFRNEFLLTSKWGKRFVRKYYKWGSKLSVYVSQSASLKYASFAVLWPAVGFASLANSFGLGLALFVYLLGFGMVVFFLLRLRRLRSA